MRVVGTFAEVRHHGPGPVGLVPTMGYLHEGHLSHVHAARQAGDGTVVMSLFVNPLQFGPDEDLARYPRDLDRDRALAEDAGVDVLFAPELDEMYPAPPDTRVEVGGPATALEARSRPGHFAGVATVVTKLFAGIRPDRAYFGRKDAQQLAVIRRLTADLSLPVEIVGGPIIRHADGLALSSRNVYLSAGDRIAAAGLCRGLMAAADAAEAGERHGPTLEALVRAALMAKPGVHVDYVELASADRVERLVELDRPAFLAVAARVGAVRLIDNIHLDPVDNGTDGKFVADRGVRLDRASVMDAGGTLMLLVVDVGNSQTVLGLYDGERLAAHWRFTTARNRTVDELRMLFRAMLELDGFSEKDVTGVAVSSVVPAVTAALRTAAAELAEDSLVVVEPGVRTGMPIHIDNPREVGADRVVNAVAARHRYGAPVVAVDFGTSTNFDVVGPEGDYLGGAIAPGLAIATDALISGTAALRKVEYIPPRSPIGKGTVEAIQSGALYGHAGLVDGIVGRIVSELGGEVTVVATGGLAPTIVPHCATVDIVDEFLTLDGLRLVYNLNHGPSP